MTTRHVTPVVGHSRVSRAKQGRLYFVAISGKMNGRAFILLGVTVFIIVTLARPMSGFIRERREVQQIRQSLVDQQNKIDDLSARKVRLKDPAYLQALARARLNYVFPGEVGFVVLDKETSTQIETVSGALVPNDDSPWFTKLWNSTKLADKARTKNNPLVVNTTEK